MLLAQKRYDDKNKEKPKKQIKIKNENVILFVLFFSQKQYDHKNFCEASHH